MADADQRYKGSNKLAMSIFPELRHAVIDDRLEQISERLAGILEGTVRDICFKDKIYGTAIKRIQRKNHDAGIVVWLSDVTSQRQHLALLEHYKAELEAEVDEKTQVLQRMQEEIILGFANIIESRDHVTGGHVKRTSGYVNILVNNLKKRNLFPQLQDPSYARHVCLAAPLHDIGKISIPDALLSKTGKFTPEEYDLMKQHSKMGSAILDSTLSALEDKEYYELARQMAEYHHERWDGCGYPNGLKGNEIPVCARIMTVADVFDALTSKRPYKEEFPMDQAFQIMLEGRGSQFDPEIIDVLLAEKEEIIQFHDANK